MTNEDKLSLIEKTIKEVEGNYATAILIQDCPDKLSLSCKEVKNLLILNNSKLLKANK